MTSPPWQTSALPSSSRVSVWGTTSEPNILPTNDHRVAANLALRAGQALTEYREAEFEKTYIDHWDIRDGGDRLAHNLLVAELSNLCPGDMVMSEEGRDDPARLDADRTWIIDPLDGTHDFPFADSIEWAVHVALVKNQRPIAAAVSVPGLDEVFATDSGSFAPRSEREQPLVVSGRSNGYFGGEVAKALDGGLTACGSSGVKAMLVVSGQVDVYVHGSGLYEWDVCAPAAVAEACGLVVTDIGGNEILYNKPDPVVRGFVVSRPEFADVTRQTLDELLD